jgi:hypothetical protein
MLKKLHENTVTYLLVEQNMKCLSVESESLRAILSKKDNIGMSGPGKNCMPGRRKWKDIWGWKA